MFIFWLLLLPIVILCTIFNFQPILSEQNNNFQTIDDLNKNKKTEFVGKKKMFNPNSWVKIIQHAFCPKFSQRWVAK